MILNEITLKQVKMSPEDFAQMIMENKPYLIELENNVAGLDFGTIEVVFTVRAGIVEGMEFVERRKKWLKPKNGH